jgi:hypothetical protein
MILQREGEWVQELELWNTLGTEVEIWNRLGIEVVLVCADCHTPNQGLGFRV